jgi:hypothetical protein
MSDFIQTIREFRTRNFVITVTAVTDDDVDVSFDETGEIARKLQSGELMAFGVEVTAHHKEFGDVAEESLWGCIYESPDEFQDHRACGRRTRELRAQGSKAVCGSYFSDMVRTVCTEARAEVKKRRIEKAAPKLLAAMLEARATLEEIRTKGSVPASRYIDTILEIDAAFNATEGR